MKRSKMSLWLGAVVTALAAAAVVSTVTLAAGGPPTGSGTGTRGAQGTGSAGNGAWTTGTRSVGARGLSMGKCLITDSGQE